MPLPSGVGVPVRVLMLPPPVVGACIVKGALGSPAQLVMRFGGVGDSARRVALAPTHNTMWYRPVRRDLSSVQYVIDR